MVIDETVEVFVGAKLMKLMENFKIYVKFNSQLMTSFVTFTLQQTTAKNPDLGLTASVLNLTDMVVLMLVNGPGSPNGSSSLPQYVCLKFP